MLVGILSVLVVVHVLLLKANNLIVFHARKAGGSTILRWLRKFKDVYNETEMNIIHIEAYPFLHENPSGKQYNFIKYTLNKYKDNALFIMIFRDPIQRILSQYDFEWRWGCLQCDVGDDMALFNLTHENYMTHLRFNHFETYKYKYSNIDLKDFLDRIEKFELMDDEQFNKKHHIVHHPPFSIYLYNYYLWILCCDDMYCSIYKDFIGINDNNNKTKNCLQTAQDMINSMDLILITEWLNDMRTQNYFNKVIHEYIGIDETKDLFIAAPHPQPHRLPSHNTMISKQDHDRLMEWNEWDLMLYQYAKRASYEKIKDAYPYGFDSNWP